MCLPWFFHLSLLSFIFLHANVVQQLPFLPGEVDAVSPDDCQYFNTALLVKEIALET